MGRPRHPDKDIEAAIQYALAKGWRIVLSSGHAWAKMYCVGAGRGACVHSVYSTPRNPMKHARQILAYVNNCGHTAPLPPPTPEPSSTKPPKKRKNR